MMKLRKLLAILLSLLLVSVLLVACGSGTEDGADSEDATPASNGETSDEEDTAGADGDCVEIVAWTFTFQPFVDGLNALAEGFNESQSDYCVTTSVFDWENYWDRIAAAVATGTGPDVFHSYTDINNKFIAQGVLQPLPEDIFDFGALAPLVEESDVMGQYWAAPMGVRTFGYIYNPDHFAEAGLEPPTTWEEQLDVARQLTIFDDDGNLVRAGQYHPHEWEGWNRFKMHCIQAGGSYITEDNRTFTWDDPACVEAFEFMLTYDNEGIWVEGFRDGEFATCWAEAACSSFVGPSGVVGALQDMDTPWEVAHVPAGPVNNVTMGNFWPLVITQQAQDEKWDAALAFVQYAMTPDATRTWAQITGDIPSLTAVAAEEEFTATAFGGFVESMPDAVFTFDPDQNVVQPIFKAAWDRVVFEGADPVQALRDGQAQAQTVLDDFWADAEANVGQ